MPVGQASSLSRMTERKLHHLVLPKTDGCSSRSPDSRRVRDRQDACPTESFRLRLFRPLPQSRRNAVRMAIPWQAMCNGQAFGLANREGSALIFSSSKGVRVEYAHVLQCIRQKIKSAPLADSSGSRTARAFARFDSAIWNFCLPGRSCGNLVRQRRQFASSSPVHRLVECCDQYSGCDRGGRHGRSDSGDKRGL